MSTFFFSEQEQSSLVEAIRQAELHTSGEIRIHIEPKCTIDPEQRAWQVFAGLDMHQTDLRNGVLIYLAYESKRFAIIGDKGIHEKVSQHFWDKERDILKMHFAQGQFHEGLVKAIHEVGQSLKTYFPRAIDDTNELSNEISFGHE